MRHKTPNVHFVCKVCGVSVSTYRSPSALAKNTPAYCSLTCLGASQTGSSNPAWNGGRYQIECGYIMVFKPEHPSSDCRGYIAEHRLVAESTIGRQLQCGEIVHHKDGNKSNNLPDNLEVLASQSEHVKKHLAEDGNYNSLRQGEWARSGFSACVSCKSSERRHRGGGLCARCYCRLWAQRKRRLNHG